MARRKKRKKGRDHLQRILVLGMGFALALCVGSVAVGVVNWYTRAEVKRLPEDIRIEVLNGTGEKGLARKAALALIKNGIDVLHVGNAERFDFGESVLIARKKSPELETLRDKLGCDRYIEQLRDETMVDATLIIGADYRELNLGPEFESSLPE
ncbi:MAG: LytR C-terminal domain-containing protein [Candidatus Latescibacterota bacterium]|nr:MAG: LytR C-terminal domain-containing protein [Candidatus Latescibacterota bacterium]